VTKAGRVYKSARFKQDKKNIEWVVSNTYPEIVKALESEFNPKEHCICAEYYFYIPQDDFFRKDGAISNTSGDADNRVKGFQDHLFKALGVDDRYVSELRATKLPTLDHGKTVVMISVEYLYQFLQAPYEGNPYREYQLGMELIEQDED
jgi:Holliday junction resolvase RusA-like endonuclease